MMSSSLSTDRPLSPAITAALAYLEDVLETAVEEGSLRQGLQWTAAIEGRRPWLALLSVQPVEAMAAAATAA